MQLQNILYAVVIVMTPIITYSICKALAQLRSYFSVHADNACFESIMMEVMDGIETAVMAVNQDYVDNLKSMDVFDEAAQKEAFSRALTIAKSRISGMAKEVLSEIYGDLDEYLGSMIEAEVRACKK